jgi:excisionase family DNA binding protein
VSAKPTPIRAQSSTVVALNIDAVRTLSVEQAAKLVGVDTPRLKAAIDAGRLRAFLSGTRHRVPVWALMEWQALEASG